MKAIVIFISLICTLTVSCQTNEPTTNSITKSTKTDSEWKEKLSMNDYYIIRKKGTETAFTGEYWDTHLKGTYHCKACGLSLFESETKFKSGTGWPSFFKAIAFHVIETQDNSNGWTRTEITCAQCDGHLGHVFNDGPKPTGLRYCVNSASLTLEEAK